MCLSLNSILSIYTLKSDFFSFVFPELARHVHHSLQRKQNQIICKKVHERKMSIAPKSVAQFRNPNEIQIIYLTYSNRLIFNEVALSRNSSSGFVAIN